MWLSVDSKAHWYPSHSPYNFSLNNPINLVDPNGQWVEGAGFWNNLLYSDKRNEAMLMAGDNGSFEKTDDSWRVARPSENSSGNNQGGFEGELLNEVEIIHLKDDGERSIDDQVGNIVRGVANTGIIVGTALAMPLVALAKNKTRKDGNRYISAKPYQLSEDVGFEQMDGSTKEVGKEVMKATIGTILLALPTTHFWKGQAVTMPVGEGNLSTIEDAVIQDLNATLLCLYGGELNLDYNSMLNVPSIGEEILFLGCEGEEYEEGNLCECEQSTYWAEMAGIECSAIPVMYWYHPDYLGSMEYVTDMTGDPYQFFFNTIWGENLQNQMAFNFKSFSSRFRFNGKEWDEETGNFYYGARYYDPQVSVWLSVDPLASEFPHVSPYNFSLNNPINLVDPDGMAPVGPGYYKASVNLRMVGFWIRHAYEAEKIGFANNSTNISSNSARFSSRGASPSSPTSVLTYGVGGNGKTQKGGQVNAFRHALWQATTTKEFGNRIANEAGNAHEENPYADVNQASYATLDAADEAADLRNNIIGRRIGRENSDLNMNDMAQKVLDEFKENGLNTVIKNDDGTYSIQKTKVSEKQYQELTNRFFILDNNGKDIEFK